MPDVLSTAFNGRAGLAAGLALSLGLAGACTKVVEPPLLEPGPPVPEPVKKRQVRPAAARLAVPPRRPGAAAPAPKEAAPVVETLNGDPEGLKREDLQNRWTRPWIASAPAWTRRAPRAWPCRSTPTPEGGAQNVKVSGGGAAAEKCVAGVVAGLSLPKFSGKPVPVHFPITVQRTVTQPAPRAPDEQRAAGQADAPAA